MAQFVVPVVVKEGEELSPNPAAIVARAQALKIPEAVNTLDGLKDTLSHLASTGSSFSILRGNLWLPLEGDLPAEPVLCVKIEQPKAREIAGNIRHTGMQEEGLFGVTAGISMRESLVMRVLETVQSLGAVLIQAPPQSGKTSLLQLLHKKAKKSPVFEKVYFANLALVNKVPFKQHFTSEAELERIYTPYDGKPSLLLLDEAQAAFPEDTRDPRDPDIRSLWGILKAVQAGSQEGFCPHNVRIVLASGWGAESVAGKNTPGTWNSENRVSLFGGGGLTLQFSEEEAIEVWNDWASKKGYRGLSEKLREKVMVATGRQPGILRRLLVFLEESTSSSIEENIDQHFLQILETKDFTSMLTNVHSINPFFVYKNAAYEKVLFRLVRTPKVACSEFSDDEKQAASDLLVKGQVVAEGGYFGLPSQVHRNFYLRCFYSNPLTLEELDKIDIRRFLIRIIMRMDSRALRESAARPASDQGKEQVPCEAHLQDEFYRALASLLAGWALFDVNGVVQFFLDRKKWAFELLQGSITAHRDRFNAVAAYVVVDMTSGPKLTLPSDCGTEFLIVTFSDDYGIATILPDGIQVSLRDVWQRF